MTAQSAGSSALIRESWSLSGRWVTSRVLRAFLTRRSAARGVGGDHGTFDERAEPPGGAARGQWEHDAFDLGAGVGVQNVGLFGDDGRASAVDEPSGERLVGGGQAVVQVDGFFDAAAGGDGGDVQGGGDFGGGHAVGVVGDQDVQQVGVQGAVGGVGGAAVVGEGVDDAGDVAGSSWLGEFGEQGDLQAGEMRQQSFGAGDRVQQVCGAEQGDGGVGQCGQRFRAGECGG